MNPVGFVVHPAFLKHAPQMEHPEHPGRLVAILNQLQHSPLNASITRLEPPLADTATVERNHSPAYVAFVQERIRAGAWLLDYGDTYINQHSWEAALRAVGGACLACDLVMRGEMQRVFCGLRPPGHHAEWNQALGFCIFNNVAVAARHLLEVHGVDRVAIVDFDIHHGNGTQHSFYDSDRVLYVSTHQYPFFFPGSGDAGERGTGKGQGCTLNLPFPSGTPEEAILEAYAGPIAEALARFRPDVLLFSAGFDGHRADPLGGWSLTTQGFGRITRACLDAAHPSTHGRTVSCLEGGYDLQALAESVEEHILQLGQ
jgi:acetoin utilization deacetylase AcuC-like enzyme